MYTPTWFEVREPVLHWLLQDLRYLLLQSNDAGMVRYDTFGVKVDSRGIWLKGHQIGSAHV